MLEERANLEQSEKKGAGAGKSEQSEAAGEEEGPPQFRLPSRERPSSHRQRTSSVPAGSTPKQSINSQTRQNQSFLQKLSRKCTRVQCDIEGEIEATNNKIAKYSKMQDYLEDVQEKLKDLDAIKYEMLPSVIQHMEQNENEQVEEAREVAVEFKRDSLNPYRKIAQWEKSVQARRRRKQ